MRRLVVGIVVAAAVVGGAALRSCATADEPVATGSTDTTTAPVVAEADGTGPRREELGVPVGWTRDDAGARAAAVSAVALTGDIARAGFITRTDMIGVLASERFAPTLAAESSTQLRDLLDVLPDSGVAVSSVLWRELPLTADVVHQDTTSARVTVWAVLVTGVPDQGAARQLWRTVTVDLVWELGDWRVDGWTAAEGPTPALAVAAPIATVDELATVTGWPTAQGGG